MSELTGSQHITEIDELILRAAREILNRVGDNTLENLYSKSDRPEREIMNIGGLRETLGHAAWAISSALIALKVNADHYPPLEPVAAPVAIPEPQSTRA